jgi:hypothetical protein
MSWSGSRFAPLGFALALACGCGLSTPLLPPTPETGAEGGAHGGNGVGGSGVGGTSGVGGSSGIGGRTGTGGAAGKGVGGSIATGGTTGAHDGGAAGSGVDGGVPPVGRRIPLPCMAPLPTGFCLQSDPGDYIGGGKSYFAGGSGSVTMPTGSTTLINVTLQDASTSSQWFVNLAAGAGSLLLPGLYDPAQRYPFQTGTAAGLSITGNGRGCNTVSGRFSIEELGRDPTSGVTRFSATLEQHCEGGTTALRGVINFQASGTPDPTPTADRTIPLSGKIFRVAYDPTANIAYGMDATNRRLAKIDLASGNTTYGDILQVPNDGCVDAKRGRLFVVNKGSTLLTEYRTSDLTSVRDISWTGTDWGPTETHFKIYCAPDRLYVVDGAWAPALFTVDGLDGTNPIATDHTAQVAGVGGLAVTASAANLYYWYQYGWSAGVLNTAVHRLVTSTLAEIDVSPSNVPSFTRNPLDAPLLLDETRGLVFAKNIIFDATNLTRVIYSLPSAFDTFNGATENAYALDAAHGHLATKSYVYELDRYSIVTPTLAPKADQLFFDTNGALWFLSTAGGTLSSQIISH